MKKTVTLIQVLLFLATSLFAGPIDQEKALGIASSFWKDNAKLRKDIQLKPISSAKASNAPSRDKTVARDAQYYIFSSSDHHGFVIVSGDDLLTPIVGYSDNGTLNEMPPALEEWLTEYSSYVDEVRAGTMEPMAKSTSTGTKIAPMLQTTWNQSSPYNNYCPEVNGQKTPTGCTATAMAQIMKFHEWPEKATKNTTWPNNITGKTETVTLTSHTYKWDKMLNNYRNGYTEEQADAVAQLMIDVGKAIQSNYALAGTGSSDIYASHALVNIFNYSPELIIVRRSEYTNEEYISIIRENLNARQPLLYTGHSQSYSSGHAFVCDGIDENDLLHIDWGWDGAYNGYFDMTAMAPGGAGIGGGADRYNVGQSMVANIRPRTSSEPNISGTPEVFMMDVVNASNQTILEQTINFNANNEASFKIAAGLLNWSHSSIVLTMAIGVEKDGELLEVSNIGEKKTLSFNDSFGYYIDWSISNNPAKEDYLEEGTYKIAIYYTDNKGNAHKVRGADNGLILKVNSNNIVLKKELPQIEVTDVMFRTTPQMKGDRLSFDAKFRTNNGKSATVLIVPVVNKLQADGTYQTTVLTNEQILMQVHDDCDMLATFDTKYSFPDNGEYNISFQYNLKNQFTDRGTTVDSKNLIEIEGKSNNLTIAPLPDGAIPSTTSLTSADIYWGESLNITATVKNIASTPDNYSGKLALFIENTGTGTRYILASADIEELEKNAETTLSYKLPDYFPTMKAGKYTAYVCEMKNGKWEKIRQSAATCNFNINNNSSPVPYLDGVAEINEGQDVVQGNNFTTKVNLNCINGDFNGYVRVIITKGLSTYIKSDYIPVSLKDGVATSLEIGCTCSNKTPLDKYRLNINYYDSNKTKLGVISTNTLTHPNNGYFWVGDATAIEDIDENCIAVTANGNGIVIAGATENIQSVIYSIDGKEIYRGTDKAVAVERGMYIVTVQIPGCKPYTTKIFVK